MTTVITRKYIDEQLNSTKIFTRAHQLTREYKQLGGLGKYRDIFAQNLRRLYTEAKAKVAAMMEYIGQRILLETYIYNNAGQVRDIRNAEKMGKQLNTWIRIHYKCDLVDYSDRVDDAAKYLFRKYGLDVMRGEQIIDNQLMAFGI